MPQMMPLNWMCLYVMFSLIILLLMTKIYFSTYNTKFKMNKTTLNKTNKMKMLW